MKTVVVIVSGRPAPGNIQEIDIQPGTTAGDVLNSLNLNGYLLSREGSAQAFAAEEEIYSVIEDGQKLRCTPIAEVGTGGIYEFIATIFGILPKVSKPRRPSRIIEPDDRTEESRTTATQAVSRRTTVRPDSRSLYEVRGWRRNGDKLVGAFRTPRGSIAGEISLASPHHPDFFVINPPKSILNGSHGACFRQRGGKRYFVHFAQSTPEIDGGIVAIEKLLAKSL